ncbi:HRAS-like suppressor 2 [Biomphalaria pfeifferi]|uniref:HRAS-like suppressor 2 n=1 Tax=Biomphalaria pfeifferi TaxID=112525 RepID=A0AAD8C462_BIOPF|nr:HRAS-like suppressor 2 [Biomphalaria pfeifferi]
MAALSPYYNHNKRVLEDARVGDKIQFRRTIYSHWGIYLGDENVIHLSGDENDGLSDDFRPEHLFSICGQMFDKANVCIDNFWKVVGNDIAYINNCDDKWCALAPEKIVKRAKEKLGAVGYNIIFSNCEHFANWCRYGQCKSDQADKFLTGVAVVGGTALAVGTVYALAKFAGKRKSQNQK